MNDTIRIQQAMAAVNAGRHAEADALATAVAQNSPVFAQACHLRGLVAAQQGRAADSLALLRRSATLGDHSPTLPTNLALIAQRAGQLDAGMVDLVRETLVGRRPAPEVLNLLLPVLAALNFHKSLGYAHVETVYYHYALPMLKWALKHEAFDHALALEAQCYEQLVKQKETEAHFREKFNEWAPDMIAAGRAFGARLPPLQPPAAARRKIGFFIHNASMLAHIEALINVLAGYRKLAEQPFDPVIYCMGGNSPEMMQAFAQLNVPVVHLGNEYPQTGNSLFQRLMKLRERVQQDGVACIVWLSLALIMPLAFTIRIAPVQVWWSMKYHGFAVDEIDAYLTSLSFTRHLQIDGRTWCSGRLQVPGRFRPELSAAAQEIAAGYRPAIILGTLAREEKMTDPAYLDAVTRILRDNPDTVFLWTGRSEHAGIAAHFREAGLSGRARFIGWVDIKLYAQVLDIFLDTFPFGCGFTALDTMAAGRPVLFMASDTSSAPSLDQLVYPLLTSPDCDPAEQQGAREIFTSPAGERLYPRAANTDEYVALAGRLVRDAGFRQAAGMAARRFIEEMMSDPRQTAADYSAHLMNAINRKLS